MNIDGLNEWWTLRRFIREMLWDKWDGLHDQVTDQLKDHMWYQLWDTRKE